MESIRVVRLEAVPRLDSPEQGQVGGAFVNVYTTAVTEAEALRVAYAEVAETGWQVVSLEESIEMDRALAERRPDALPYFEQALLDGIVLVFHQFPLGGKDETDEADTEGE